jgi:hypothetical protein
MTETSDRRTLLELRGLLKALRIASSVTRLTYRGLDWSRDSAICAAVRRLRAQNRKATVGSHRFAIGDWT